MAASEKPLLKESKESKQFEKVNNDDLKVEIEYVPEQIDFSFDPNLAEFADIFKEFQVAGQEDGQDDLMKDKADKSDSELEESEEEEISKKDKRAQRMSVAQLKQLVEAPEVVEWEDVASHDPLLLVSLKSSRNTVPIPKNWNQKRKYLQYKRGVEKRPFELPAFIRDTGITEMRESIREKDDSAQAKTRQREKVQPRMNKLVIDYQRLHDAFFRFQTPPENLTRYGEVFYEGKEFETQHLDFQPGFLSQELKEALGIPPLAPPPWLINMQRYGPPPSYPDILIPGLSAPIPLGAQWGYHPGGWGRPPVDTFGKPLYGDVFGTNASGNDYGDQDIEADCGEIKHWGSMDGITTPSGIISVPSGLETPDVIQLRKETVITESYTGPKQLYTVLPEKQAHVGASALMGSQHVYDLSGTGVGDTSASLSGNKKRGISGNVKSGVAVALDPQEVANMDEETLRAKYESQISARNAELASGEKGEDFSDMVAEHAQQQARKRQRQKNTEYKF
ncbi:hypothetical protein BB558_006236 [Smittium angustum]|uniref:PSP proline-rich domain-containing protein n=1 Tax=Smittium angustum TaxID=133377 RepID=A0A2U1IYB4_SMIAN|nr:hypothetical protein BB558_006236 [Smittium angustum]